MNYKRMKFWIGGDQDLSERVQKILFDLGYGWLSARVADIKDWSIYSLYADAEGRLTYSVNEDATFYHKECSEEINLDWMRKPVKLETVELNGKHYLKSELEEALKHLNPIEE